MPVVSVGEAGFARLVGRSGAVVSVDGARVHLLLPCALRYVSFRIHAI